jgi:hypothetical protein
LCVLTFNDLLRAVSLDLATVRLVRHRDPNAQREVFETALRGDPASGEYQEHHASFVVDPMAGETVFVDMSERLGDRTGSPPRVPLSIQGTHSAAVASETRRIDALAAHCSRVVIRSGNSARVWVQRADNQPEPILEIRLGLREPDFPGFARFCRQVDQMSLAWRAVLSNAWGIRSRDPRGRRQRGDERGDLRMEEVMKGELGRGLYLHGPLQVAIGR